MLEEFLGIQKIEIAIQMIDEARHAAAYVLVEKLRIQDTATQITDEARYAAAYVLEELRIVQESAKQLK